MFLSRRIVAVLLALSCFAAISAAEPLPSSTISAVAVRTPAPVVIDGRDDDAIWRTAPAISDFTQFAPLEGGPARFKTEAKVAFDDHEFYVFIRAFDPEPSK